MNIGFIGAGKVGFSLGKYLTQRGVCITGYFSRSWQSTQEAAAFTNTKPYTDMASLVADSDAIFLTVSDGAIASVWEQLKELPLQNKQILHCSGMLSSAIFSDIGPTGALGFSIHPLLAIPNKNEAYKALEGAFFVLEGDEDGLLFWQSLFAGFGNETAVILAEHKVRYHAACAMASNLYVGLCAFCEELLSSCGFSSEKAHLALAPLILGNAKNIASAGPVQSLTGPIERNDAATVAAHLSCLSPEEAALYRILSKEVVKVAEKKHPDRNYTTIKGDLTP